MNVDVAIIGAGPGGSTCAGMIRRYAPDLRVAVFERELFPREHIGESQLPQLTALLGELGCWPEVEQAHFPIKIGATYRWGSSPKLWDFEFVPAAAYRVEQRPRPLTNQAKQLAFQVDRGVYDQILADHAARLGAQIHLGLGVRHVLRDGDSDRILGLTLRDGRTVTARWYVDASGGAAVIRRAMGVAVDTPTKLQNVAFWDYWYDTDWAVRATGDATRVLVLSIGCGWIWFIPISADKTSIGFVCPASYYKGQERAPRELYDWALAQEPLIGELTRRARRDGQVRATKDWSFLAERMVGENWFLVGEAGGFADPILAAGLTLTQTCAREAAYTIVALARREHDPEWLKRHYDENQRSRIGQHIRFADFWYSANGEFTDLQDYTREIARDAGLDLTPQQAFQWLGTGGFTHDLLGQAVIGGFDLGGVRQLAQRLVDVDEDVWQLSRYNRFVLTLDGAERTTIPAYRNGAVHPVACLVRGRSRLPLIGAFRCAFEALERSADIGEILPILQRDAEQAREHMSPDLALRQIVMCIELMLNEGWVRGELDPERPRLVLTTPREGGIIHSNVDLAPLQAASAAATAAAGS